MMAPVASRTGTCQSLVAILLLLEKKGGGLVAPATYSLADARARSPALWMMPCAGQSRLVRSPNERSIRFVLALVGSNFRVLEAGRRERR
jgi:hypothetical protein